MDKVEKPISRTRLGQQTLRSVESLGGKTVSVQPRDLASAATADIGGDAARNKVALDDVVQVGRRRLSVPIFRKRGRILVVGGERLTVHGAANPVSWKNRRPHAWWHGFR